MKSIIDLLDTISAIPAVEHATRSRASSLALRLRYPWLDRLLGPA